jgi:large subunit ribosomal protein L28
MAKCENCGKGKLGGATSRHSRGVASKKFEKRAHKSKRVLKPNLHRASIVINGVRKSMLLCTKCLKKLKTQMLNVKSKKDLKI